MWNVRRGTCIAVVFLLLSFALALTSARVKSATFDEDAYVGKGAARGDGKQLVFYHLQTDPTRGVAAIHAFTPMRVFISGSVNNDSLVITCSPSPRAVAYRPRT